jgi:hypothetical protein
MNEGKAIPPFHGRCWCTLIAADGPVGKGYTDGISLITSKEPFNIKDGKAVELAFKKFEKETRDSPIEKAIVISLDGYKYEIDGRQGVVGIHLVGDKVLKSSKVIHNHPGFDAESFSKQDFVGFFEYNIDILEVAYKGKRHRIQWEGKRLTSDDAYNIYKETCRILDDEVIEDSAHTEEKEQYSIMKYLEKHLKGLCFYEL